MPDQPFHVLAVDDVQIGPPAQRGDALFGCAEHAFQPQAGQVLPLAQLGNPGVPRHAQRRDNQDAAHLEAVVEQMGHGGQGNGRLAQPHVEKYAALRMRPDELHAEALVVMQVTFRKRPCIAGVMCVHGKSAPIVYAISSSPMR